jgi:hypothetical protein
MKSIQDTDLTTEIAALRVEVQAVKARLTPTTARLIGIPSVRGIAFGLGRFWGHIGCIIRDLFAGFDRLYPDHRRIGGPDRTTHQTGKGKHNLYPIFTLFIHPKFPYTRASAEL